MFENDGSELILRACLMCGKECVKKPGRPLRKTCSDACYDRYKAACKKRNMDARYKEQQIQVLGELRGLEYRQRRFAE